MTIAPTAIVGADAIAVGYAVVDTLEVRPTTPPLSSWLLLALGVFAATTAAVLARYASQTGISPLDITAWRAQDTAHPAAVALWRCGAGAVILYPFARKRLRTFGHRDLRSSALAGVFLAVHFAAWLSSLGLTSVGASVLLVSTTPIFAAITGRFFLRERLSGRGWGGIALAFAGTALISGGNVAGDADATALAGNLLALLGGAMAAGYVLAGQAARRHLGVLEYSSVAYAVAALILLLLCLAAGIPLTGFDASVWLALVALVVGPQLLGHTVLNLVLKDFGATVVSVAIMLEPPIAITLAYLLFSEVPSALVVPGGIAILTGIYAVSTARRQEEVPPE